ncbi:MAG: glycoside hydrolase family 9 protein [Opitutaceae bacterium]|nr:glycoside hydrolase family 9 protein [Opitutaceae bacterium]
MIHAPLLLLPTYRRLIALAALFSAVVNSPVHADESLAFPLKLSEASEEGSARQRWLDKPVQRSVPIDEVESLAGWETRGVGKIELIAERARFGKHALRFSAPMWNREFFEHRTGPKLFGTTGGATQAVRLFAQPQDWSAFNRLSVWIYVHDTGRRTYNVSLLFTCLGVPERTTEPFAAFNANSLKPGAWHRIVWEIPYLKRDRVTEFIVHIETSGYDSDARGDLVVDVDQIELQQVEADKWQGWAIERDRIALSQIGYAPHARKVALMNPNEEARFEVVDAETGESVLIRPISTTAVKKTGRFAALDFSDLRKPGAYFLRAGSIRSDAFAVADSFWRPALIKALNFFYCERCGVDIAGVHNACHHDLTAEDGGETKPIFGGWHDAADFSQLTGNTAEAAYAMLEMAGQLRLRDTDHELRQRIEEECRVGLDWLRKTIFASGKRVHFVEIRHFSDGVPKTGDERKGTVGPHAQLNFICAATLARAASYFQPIDPDYAQVLRETALRDWQSGVSTSPDPRTVALTELSWSVLAGIQLERLTGDPAFRTAAVERAHYAIECQERTFPEGVPLTGYFYSKPDRQRISQPDHMCHDEAALLAFAALCSSYPSHPDWMRWYSAAAIYAEFFLSRGADYMAPFQYLPNGVYRKSDITALSDEKDRIDQLEQLEAGTRLTDGYYLRALPIWTSPWARGGTGIQMSRTVALSAAAGLANDLGAQQLARWQIEWVFGRNPFTTSFMYGVGHYQPMHSHRQGELIGSLPVGIDCMGGDEPFWPGGTNHTNKEIWVVPVARFIWSMASLALPAYIEGSSERTLTFIDKAGGHATAVDPDATGHFRCSLPAGEYVVRAGDDEWETPLVSGRNYRFDMRAGCGWKARLSVSGGDGSGKTRRLQLSVTGRGRHSISLHFFNARCDQARREITLESESTVEWEIEVIDPAQPWVAVVIPEGNADLRLSAIGK